MTPVANPCDQAVGRCSEIGWREIISMPSGFHPNTDLAAPPFGAIYSCWAIFPVGSILSNFSQASSVTFPPPEPFCFFSFPFFGGGFLDFDFDFGVYDIYALDRPKVLIENSKKTPCLRDMGVFACFGWVLRIWTGVGDS